MVKAFASPDLREISQRRAARRLCLQPFTCTPTNTYAGNRWKEQEKSARSNRLFYWCQGLGPSGLAWGFSTFSDDEGRRKKEPGPALRVDRPIGRGRFPFLREGAGGTTPKAGGHA